MQKKIKLFGNLRVLCAAAILTALAVAIAYVCKFMTFGSIRITFENLPIILSGYLYGPVVGMLVGLASDLLNTAVSQYGIGGINPIITLGAATVGFMSGLRYSKKPVIRLGTAVGQAHIFGNMIIKSIGLMVMYSYPLAAVLPRIPLYIIIGIIEFTLLYFITRSNALKKVMGGKG